MRVMFYYFLLFCVILPSSLLCQSAIPDCLPNKDGWGDKKHFTLSSVVEILSSVDYYARLNGTKTEIYIDWDSFTNRCAGLTDSSAKELTQLDLLGSYVMTSGICKGDGQEVSISVVYKTECTMVTKCLATVDQSQKVECSDDPSIVPSLFEYNGRSYHVILQRQTCGFSCCEAIYTYKCNMGKNPVLISLFKQEYPGATCTGSSNFDFIDCITNQPVQCEHDCK